MKMKMKIKLEADAAMHHPSACPLPFHCHPPSPRGDGQGWAVCAVPDLDGTESNTITGGAPSSGVNVWSKPVMSKE